MENVRYHEQEDIMHRAQRQIENYAKPLTDNGIRELEIFHGVLVTRSETFVKVSAVSLNGKRQIEATAYSAGRLTCCVNERLQKDGALETTLELWANTIFNEDEVLQYYSSRSRFGCLVGEPAKEKLAAVSVELIDIIDSQKRYSNQSKAGQFITRLFAQ